MHYIFAILLLCSVTYPVHAMSSNANKNLKYMDYKVQTCTPRDTGVSFWFTTEDKKSRHFALSNADKRLFLSFSGGKGNIGWNAIERITYLQLNDNEGYITLIFKEEQNFLSKEKVKSLEFGVMNIGCWEILSKNVSGEIPLEINGN